MAQAEMEIPAPSSTSEAKKGGGLQQLAVVSPQWAAAAELDASHGDDLHKQQDNLGVPPLCPSRSSGVGTETAPEQYPVELLHRAAQIIKEERARSAALQQELNALRKSAAVKSAAQQLQLENQELKRRLLSLQRQVDGTQASELPAKHQGGKGKCHTPFRCSTSPSLEHNGRASSRPSASRTPLTPSSTNGVVGGSYSDTRHKKRQAASLQRQHLLASSESSRERTFVGSQRPVERRPPASLASPPPSPEVSQKPSTTANEKEAVVVGMPQPFSKSPVARELWRATTAHDCEKAYSLGMITRLRRAMAPPPTKEQLGEVIQAMVHEVVRDARRRGISLKMTRQAPCVYRCELYGTVATNRKGKDATARVVHLSIVSGRLAVKVGSGHENFLEYLERCRSLSSVMDSRGEKNMWGGR
ncbi:putative myosin heavy chain [Trypanosoma rangeli]|uniref:Putative myosin heavy chain n=1 Tax=Trypanosoma rangeli TaxID=5698 RepID=A0A3R7MJ91_TRYRA|nr:putative myosin heavy chain [Trypanosoma rangeli]RNF06913.1 putative myosin heavy chain [Trypanosoma rangeli]|eukprot:RNF06913.1 putative myosin heavy chain [Trypanosoma rangeli]